MRTSFILHLDSLVILEEMTNEQKGILFDAIYKFNLGKEVELDFAMKMAFTPFKNQFIRDVDKYGSFVDKQKENGKKGGRPKKVIDSERDTINPQEPNATQKTQPFLKEPKKPYKDSVSDSVSVKDKEKKNKYGEFQNVLLTETEYNSSQEKYKHLLPKMIKKLDEYIASKGTKYKSHYATFSSWVYDSVVEDMKKNTQSSAHNNHGIPVN